ncbi:MAG: DUF423 domain-containing protein [Chlamydiales bacterium]
MFLNFSQFGMLFAAISVILGAFGAHALKSKLSAEMLTVFEVGVRYQMYHALGLILLGIWALPQSNPYIIWAGWSFIIGIVLFSGSLYLLSLTGINSIGAITPIGGLFFITGWLLFLLGSLIKGS